MLRQFAQRIVASPVDAEDAAQQALVKVFAQAARFDSTRDGVAWALTITAFECRTMRRRAQRRREQISDGAPSETAATGASPEVAAIECQLEAAARDVLRGLREEDIRTIVAAISDERPAGDAAFRKRLERALVRLRTAWREKHGTE
jgi:RNA polymerase sigma-70 factor (ECF subfamily)